MGIAALILGVLGFVGVLLSVPMMMPALLFGGGGVSVAAFVIGFIGRDSGAGKAGLVLGLLGLIAGGSLVLLLTSRSVPTASGGPTAVETRIEATPPAKIEAAPTKAQDSPPPS